MVRPLPIHATRYRSCRGTLWARHCPKCQGAAREKWLEHHLHLHCVVPGGGLSPDHNQWISGFHHFRGLQPLTPAPAF